MYTFKIRDHIQRLNINRYVIIYCDHVRKSNMKSVEFKDQDEDNEQGILKSVQDQDEEPVQDQGPTEYKDVNV